MKKIFISLGLAVAATLTLTNCAKELVSNEIAGGEEFSLYAGIDTKTANDGLSTKWVSGDNINVFYEEVGSEGTFSANTMFTMKKANVETGEFTTTATITLDEQADGYNWYAIYPYLGKITTPANVADKDGKFPADSYLTVGGVSQTQAGNNSTAHLSGKGCPLYGVAMNVANGAKPAITMKNVTTVVEFAVKNSSSKAFSVDKIEFTAGEDIVGTYYINFTADPIAFVSSGANYVSKKATLTVTDGAPIAAGGTAKFYIAMKPLTTSATLSVKVYATDSDSAAGSFTKDIAAGSRTFTAGKIKTVNVDVTALSKEKVYTIADINTAGEGSSNGDTIGTYPKMTPATVVAVTGTNYILRDETGVILFYKSGESLKVGDIVEYSGTVKNYYGVMEFTGTDLSISKTGAETSLTHTPTVDFSVLANVQNYIAKPAIACVSLKGKVTDAGTIQIDGLGDDKIKLYAGITIPKGEAISGVGYFYGYHNGNKEVRVILSESSPIISITPDSKTWAYNETDAATFSITTAGTPTITVPDALKTNFTITSSPTATGGTVTVTPKASNTSGADFTGEISVTFGGFTKEISLKQQKQPSAGGKTITFDFTDTKLYPSGFPNGSSAGIVASSEQTYKFKTTDGEEYELGIKAPVKFYIIKNNGVFSLFFGKTTASFATTAYIKLPVISGKTLKKVEVVNGGGISAGVAVNIYDNTGKTYSTAVNTEKGGTMTFELSSTTANTAYYVSSLTKDKNLQLDKFTLTYE